MAVRLLPKQDARVRFPYSAPYLSIYLRLDLKENIAKSMRITLWMAMSMNGMIATPDNKEDFLSHNNWVEFVKATKKAGGLIWGHKTYETVRKWDSSYLRSLERVTKVIVSRNKGLKLNKGFVLAGSPKAAIDVLRKKGFKEVILTGGSRTNSAFAKLGLINEVKVNVEGVIMGRGIPLFCPESFKLNLRLTGVRKISRNIIQLHYQVKK